MKHDLKTFLNVIDRQFDFAVRQDGVSHADRMAAYAALPVVKKVFTKFWGVLKVDNIADYISKVVSVDTAIGGIYFEEILATKTHAELIRLMQKKVYQTCGMELSDEELEAMVCYATKITTNVQIAIQTHMAQLILE